MENKTFGSSVLVTLGKAQKPEDTLQALTLLQKLLMNIFNNPSEQKFRGIKTSNATLKAKLFNISGMENLLKDLGFVLIDDTYTYLDDNVAPLTFALANLKKKIEELEYSLLPADEQKRRREIEERQRDLNYRFQKEKEEHEKLKHLTDLDKMERAKKEKAKDSIANKRDFGAKATTYKDIGIDLCKQSKG